MRRDLDPADGATLPVLDFDGAEAVTPVQRNVTINNLGADIATVLTGYVTDNGAGGDFYHDFLASNVTMRTWFGVPTGVQESDDLHVLTVATSPTGADFATRSAARYFRDAVDQTLTLGPALGNVTLSNVPGAPYSRTRVQYSIQAEYDDQFLIVLGTSNGSARGFLINVSAGWLAGATDLDVTTPDFSGTSGWNNAWGIPIGMQASWFLRAAGWTGTGVLTAPLIEGTETVGASRGGLYTS